VRVQKIISIEDDIEGLLEHLVRPKQTLAHSLHRGVAWNADYVQTVGWSCSRTASTTRSVRWSARCVFQLMCRVRVRVVRSSRLTRRWCGAGTPQSADNPPRRSAERQHALLPGTVSPACRT
jgi:hypothetical protein